MRKFALLITCLLLCGMHVVFAQSRSITGTVTDADDGSTLPGVSVVVTGTSIGTVTDIDGKFSLNVPADAKVLRFSFVGYASEEVDISSSTSVSVALERAAYDVDEVIVSGVASETPRTKLSVSVGKVGAADLQEVPAGSAASALQGKMAGVTVVNATGSPGDAATILVRGATQLAGSQDPLIILDGAIMEGTLADINVDDIESIEVVKGASASALYGSRAGNGVIAIATKRGKGIGKSLVIFRNEIGMNSLAKKYDLATHHAYVMADDWETAQGKYTKYAGVTYPADYDGTQEISGARVLDADQYMDNPYGVLQDHEQLMFPGNTFYTNYLSVAGSHEKTNFLASFENFNQGGLLFETEGYRRNSFRVNVDHKITDNLILSASNLYVKSTTDEPGGDSKYNGGNFFNVLLASPDVDYFRKNPDGQNYLFIPDPWEATTENPLYNLWKIEVKNTRERMLGSYNLKWIMTDFLNLKAKYAFENSASNWTEYQPYDTYVRSGDGFTYS
ncbi:MAG TPA: carboxypeptidase-like regulatory domain-containing protein, partial [Prolixibacteraceae bacterium]|nr:carboxypeptidase-like regulatory domain-containing protein [Prolixibacteraceae bacterium]